MKTCSKCGETKDFGEFYKNINIRDGYGNQCKKCHDNHRMKLKLDPIAQLKKEIRSSIIMENKILSKDNKKMCCTCKNIYKIQDFLSGGRCIKCQKAYKQEYARTDKYKAYQKEQNKEYYLKKKLEKQQLEQK